MSPAVAMRKCCRWRVAPLVVLGCVALAGCGRKTQSVPNTPSPAMAASRPRLASVTPASVEVVPGNVVELTLRGSGFDMGDERRNVVRIGRVTLTSVPATDAGRVIRVVIPDGIPSGGEAPPSPWMGESYPVTVTTPLGTSDTLRVVITMGGRDE